MEKRAAQNFFVLFFSTLCFLNIAHATGMTDVSNRSLSLPIVRNTLLDGVDTTKAATESDSTTYTPSQTQTQNTSVSTSTQSSSKSQTTTITTTTNNVTTTSVISYPSPSQDTTPVQDSITNLIRDIQNTDTHIALPPHIDTTVPLDQMYAPTQTEHSSERTITTCTPPFTKNLQKGDIDPEVQLLQEFLNSMEETHVAKSGAGSPGAESVYFGSNTKSAVARYQELHAAEILAPLGLKHGTGSWGSATRAFANTSKCGVTIKSQTGVVIY